MATNATPQPTAAPAVNPNELSPEQIADQLANQSAPVNNPPVEPLQRDFTVELETGEVYRGATKDELVQAIAKGKVNASKEIKRLKDQLATQAPPSTPPVSQPAPAFNNEQYWQLAAEDPRKAQQYLWQFTPEAQELRQQVSELQAMKRDIQNRTEVATFQSAVNDFDFENQDTIKTFDENFEKLGLPLTAQNLIMAHNHFVKTGVYQPKAQPQVQSVTNSGVQPLPTLQSHPANGQPTQQIDPNTMTQADLLAYIKSLNGQ
jgi:hypothetical protein